MRVLVTGGAGFIGSRLAEALLAHGHDVTILDDLSTGSADNVPAGAHFVHDDVVALRHIPDLAPFELIYHAAASYRDRDAWEHDARTNVLGTIAVVREALATGARLVYFQTSLCYGPRPASPIGTAAVLDPRSSYAVSKTAAECYIRDSGVDYVSLRLANIYGPRNLSGPIPTFYRRLRAGQPCTVVDARRDYVFVDDLVWLAVRAADRGIGVFHVSSGSDVSIADIHREVARAMGLEVPEPALVRRGADDVATLLLDPSETSAAFGWTARTPLTDGIAAAVGWYDAHGVSETFTHLAMKG